MEANRETAATNTALGSTIGLAPILVSLRPWTASKKQTHSKGALHQIWSSLGGEVSALERVSTAGPERALPSAFRVTELATGAVTAATLAAACDLAEWDSLALSL